MPMNDRPLPIGGPTAARPNEGSRPQGVSLEVPVTLQGLPGPGGGHAFYEDTRTVLVMAQGAVVRLAADAVQGQKVVLTNPRTRQEVLARVVLSRSHPNTKGYAEVEFTQTAPGFWGVSFPSEAPSRAASQPPAPTVTPSQPIAAVTTPPESQPKPPVIAPMKPRSVIQDPAAVSAPAMRPSIPAGSMQAPGTPLNYERSDASPDLVPLADVVKKHHAAIPPAAATSPLQTPAVPVPTPRGPVASFAAAEAVSASFGPKSTTEVVTLRIPQFGESARPTGSRLPRALVFVGVAAVALAGGVGFFLYTSRAAGVDQTVLENAAPPTTPPTAEESGSAQPSDTAPAAAADASSTATAVSATQPAPQVPSEAPASAARPAFMPPASASAPVETFDTGAKRERRIAPKVTLSAPIVDASKAAITPVEPAPNVAPAAVPSSMTAPALPMTLSNAPAPPPPAAPAPPRGGQAQLAKLISSAPPAYPPMAKMQRLQGEVLLDVSIDDTGKVTKVAVVSGPAVFHQSAIDAVMRWRYEPARLNGQPTATHAQVRVFFRP